MNLDLKQLSHAKQLFKQLNSGTHLNRDHDNQLFAVLEKYSPQYSELFKTLGFELVINTRGYAYFKTEKTSNTNTHKLTQKLALFMLLLFEYQADAGVDLSRFDQWQIDNELITVLWQKNHSLLEAEDINNIDELKGVLKSAERVGFVAYENNHYHLLAAVYRYLDLFEELELQRADKKQANNTEEA
jgi:hypothetical protein